MEVRFKSAKSAKAAVRRQGLHLISHEAVGPIDDNRGGFAVQFYLNPADYQPEEEDIRDADRRDLRAKGFRV